MSSTLFIITQLISCIVLSLLPTFGKKDETAQPGSAASHHLPVEAHHSLHHPFDVSLPYWRYGGSTVATESFIRLTPNSQSKAGWIFNEFELQSSDWEIELHFNAWAEYHIGGDGLGLWILNDTHHPRKAKHHNYLSGPIFGLRSDFQGFGIIFDTYDNDQNRDNPLIASVKQSKGEKQSWNHDNDFQDNMVKETPNGLDYECTGNYRGENVFKVIIRYIGGILHVYTAQGGKIDDRIYGNNNNNNGKNKDEEYAFCLATEIKIESKNMYIAITAMTGQVADRHDIYSLTTRYLDSSDFNKIDDKALRKGYRGKSIAWRHIFFWLLIVMIHGYLIFEVIYEFYMFDQMKSNSRNPVIICQELNPHIIVSYVLHTALIVILILIGYWRFMFVNAVVIGWRANQYMTDNWKLESVKIRKLRGIMDIGQIIGTGIKTLLLVISAIMAIWKLFG